MKIKQYVKYYTINNTKDLVCSSFDYEKNKTEYTYSVGAIDNKHFSEIEFSKLEKILSHIIVNCEYYSKKYNRDFNLSRNIYNWGKNKLWGAYNRVYELDHDELEKEYQISLREMKLKRIIKGNI